MAEQIETIKCHCKHRVDTYTAVTGRRKHCGNLRFHVPIFFRRLGKKDQLCVLGKFSKQLKRAAIQYGMHVHKKVDYTSYNRGYNSVYASTLCHKH